MTPQQLEMCVKAFRDLRPTTREANVHIDTDNDQVTLGFKILPRLTDDWRTYRAEWEKRVEQTESLTASTTPVPLEILPVIDEDALEQAYWDMDALRKTPRIVNGARIGPVSESEAFKHVVRAFIRQHLRKS